MNKIQLYFDEERIFKSDHPGINRSVYCPHCGELLWFLRRGNNIFLNFSVLEFPMFCFECKEFFFVRSSPFRIREIPKAYKFKVKKEESND